MLCDCSTLPLSGFLLYYTFFVTPVLQAVRDAWDTQILAELSDAPSGLQTWVIRSGSGAGVVLRWLEKLRERDLEKGTQGEASDHLMSASVNRLYLRQG